MKGVRATGARGGSSMPRASVMAYPGGSRDNVRLNGAMSLRGIGEGCFAPERVIGARSGPSGGARARVTLRASISILFMARLGRVRGCAYPRNSPAHHEQQASDRHSARSAAPFVAAGVPWRMPTGHHMHAVNDVRLMQALLAAMEYRGSWKNWAESKASLLLVCRTSQ